MAKLTADEFIKKYTVDKKINEDDDVLIELMEDVSDSINVDDKKSEELEQLKAEKEQISADYADLKERYKNRFLSSEKIDNKQDYVEEPEEKEVIDIKEI